MGGDEAAAKAKAEATAVRQLANDLVNFQPFREWAAREMIASGYFGWSKQMTDYQQGRRGGVVDLFERVCEQADDGDGLIREVFAKLKNTEKRR